MPEFEAYKQLKTKHTRKDWCPSTQFDTG